MTSIAEQQEVRAKFYGDPTVVKYIKIHGVPKSKHAFKDMVGSGSTENLDSKKGLDLIACLGEVVFRDHTQQVNIMDKSNGKIIASLKK